MLDTESPEELFQHYIDAIYCWCLGKPRPGDDLLLRTIEAKVAVPEFKKTEFRTEMNQFLRASQAKIRQELGWGQDDLAYKLDDTKPSLSGAIREVWLDFRGLGEAVSLLCALPNQYRQIVLNEVQNQTKTQEKVLTWEAFHSWCQPKVLVSEQHNHDGTTLSYKDGTWARIDSAIGKNLTIKVFEPYNPPSLE